MSIIISLYFVSQRSENLDPVDTVSIKIPYQRDIIDQKNDLIKRSLISEIDIDIKSRTKAIAKCLLLNPDDVKARGLAGYVRYHGEWIKHVQVSDMLNRINSNSSIYLEYNRKKSHLHTNSEDHWKLANWCDRNGLIDEARSHYIVSGCLNSNRVSAWEKVGYVNYQGFWMDESSYRRSKDKQLLDKESAKYWNVKFKTMKQWLKSKDKKDQAILFMESIKDPHVVKSVEDCFVNGDKLEQGIALNILSNINSRESSLAICHLILNTLDSKIRNKAYGILSSRDVNDYLIYFTSFIIENIKISYSNNTHTNEPCRLILDFGDFYSVYDYENIADLTNSKEFFRDYILKRGGLEFHQPLLGNTNWNAPSFAPTQIITMNQILYHNVQEYTISKSNVDMVINNDRIYINYLNSKRQAHNDKIIPYLKRLSGYDFGYNRRDWVRWSLNRCHYNTSHFDDWCQKRTMFKPVFYNYISLNYRPTYIPYPHCFHSDTLVKTLTGDKPIRSIQIGDLVLSEDVESGELSYQPVINLMKEDSEVMSVYNIKSNRLKATNTHRIWKIGYGWIPLGESSSRDRLRLLNGTTSITGFESNVSGPVYNLIVHRNHNYFVDSIGLLVHDGTDALRVDDPFDSPSN